MMFVNNSTAFILGYIIIVKRYIIGFEKSMLFSIFILLLLIGGYCKDLKIIEFFLVFGWGLVVGNGGVGVFRCLEILILF